MATVFFVRPERAHLIFTLCFFPDGQLCNSLLSCNINITLQDKAEDLYIAKSFY